MFKRALITATAIFIVAQSANAETRVVVDSVPSPAEFAHILGIELPEKPKSKLLMRGIKMHAEPEATKAEVEAEIHRKWDVAEVAEAPSIAAPKVTSNYETTSSSYRQPSYTVTSLPPVPCSNTAIRISNCCNTGQVRAGLIRNSNKFQGLP